MNLEAFLTEAGTGQRPLRAADYARVARELSREGFDHDLRPLRAALLSSCSFQFAEPFLVVEGARRGLQLRTFFGPFNQFEQQVSDPRSALHRFESEALVLFMRPEDLDPDFGFRSAHGSHSEVLASAVDRLVSCVENYRSRSAAPVLVANFAVPQRVPLGLFDANVSDSLTHALAEANHGLRSRLADIPGTVVWDYAGLVRDAGTSTWTDPRMWALARVPVSAERQPTLARHLARTLAAVTFPPAKCLVLDLDNTLWGGVIGDDGIDGIQLGDDYPGSVFKAFQRAVLGLTDRGILLAVVSKNYQSVVDQVLRAHPEMLIRPEHLSAMRVNWQPKSTNLREIAAELNIGADALVHFDDSPVERGEIAANAPEVRLVDVPADPLGYERALHECGYFDMVAVSQEDRQRVQMYRAQKTRDDVRASSGTVEEFLAGLDMIAEIGAVDSANIGRVAQLVGKTNQFNLTTRRHSQADIARMCSDADHSTMYIRLRDRFGDLGLIAVGLVSYQGTDAVIDTLVMSCRAMGRQVEIALLWEIAEAARSRGCLRLIGDYVPTARNGIVSELYPSLGFSRIGAIDNGGERFGFNLADLPPAALKWPDSIRRETALSVAG